MNESVELLRSLVKVRLILCCLGKDFVWSRLIQSCCGITKVRGQGKIKPMLAGIGLLTCLGVGKDFVWSRLIQSCCGITKVRGQGKVTLCLLVLGW